MKGARFQREESVGLLFWQVSTLWQRAVKAALRPFGLTHTQYVILAVIAELGESGGDITQAQISGISMVDVMTVSSSLRLLERKSLVRRAESQTDGRANAVRITDKGLALLRKAVAEVERTDSSFFLESEADAASLMLALRALMQPFHTVSKRPARKTLHPTGTFFSVQEISKKEQKILRKKNGNQLMLKKTLGSGERFCEGEPPTFEAGVSPLRASPFPQHDLGLAP